MADQEKGDSLEQIEDWQNRYEAGDQDARDLFRQLSNIAVCLSYDTVDKVRWWEKDTLGQSDEEVDKRLQHMSRFLEQLRTAYLTFAELDY